MIPRFCYDFSIRDLFYSLLSIKRDDQDSLFKERMFCKEKMYFANSGRTCLKVVLESLNLRDGAKIGVQAYNCHTVFQAIKEAGCTPLFIDINERYSIDTEDRRKKKDKMDALIVLHTFGIPADWDEIKEIAGSLPLIEDCAHSLFSIYRGKFTGTLGTASFFSFGHGKYPSIGKGGFMLVSDEKLADSCRENMEKLKKESILSELKNVAVNYIWALAYRRLLYSLITFPFLKKLDSKVDFLDKFVFHETKGFKSNASFFLANYQRFAKNHEKQMKNGRFVSKELNGMFRCIQGDNTGNTEFNYYIFPLRSVHREEIVLELKKNGIESGRHFYKSPEWASEFGYITGECPNTELIVREVFTVPVNYKLKERELKKIVGVLREFHQKKEKEE